MKTNKQRDNHANPPQEMKNDPGFLSVSQAAHWLSVADVTVRKLLAKKRLHRYKLGRRTLLSFEEVKALVQK